jgi:hypothetical protein
VVTGVGGVVGVKDLVQPAPVNAPPETVVFATIAVAVLAALVDA